MMFLKSSVLFALVLVFTINQAQAGGRLETGDGDPFPLQCVDFSGLWRSDNGTRYQISQTECKYIRLKMLWNNYTEDTISIVPDNKNRLIPGHERSAVRHRWNSNRHGSVIESHRTFIDGRNKISEIVMYERAHADLLLETTYTTVECLDKPCKITRDYQQQVFRRANQSTDPGFVRKRAK